MIRTYSELRPYQTFEERYSYLLLRGNVGEVTFGFDRYLNQRFYRSREWRDLRNYVIVRDNGCDLGLEGYEIYDRIHIHHMNPMSVDNVIRHDEDILDPEFLITTSHKTHNAIHYGDETPPLEPFVERRVGDTHLW